MCKYACRPWEVKVYIGGFSIIAPLWRIWLAVSWQFWRSLLYKCRSGPVFHLSASFVSICIYFVFNTLLCCFIWENRKNETVKYLDFWMESLISMPTNVISYGVYFKQIIKSISFKNRYCKMSSRNIYWKSIYIFQARNLNHFFFFFFCDHWKVEQP